jgi:hypothetical protein
LYGEEANSLAQVGEPDLAHCSGNKREAKPTTSLADFEPRLARTVSQRHLKKPTLRANVSSIKAPFKGDGHD